MPFHPSQSVVMSSSSAPFQPSSYYGDVPYSDNYRFCIPAAQNSPVYYSNPPVGTEAVFPTNGGIESFCEVHLQPLGDHFFSPSRVAPTAEGAVSAFPQPSSVVIPTAEEHAEPRPATACNSAEYSAAAGASKPTSSPVHSLENDSNLNSALFPRASPDPLAAHFAVSTQPHVISAPQHAVSTQPQHAISPSIQPQHAISPSVQPQHAISPNMQPRVISAPQHNVSPHLQPHAISPHLQPTLQRSISPHSYAQLPRAGGKEGTEGTASAALAPHLPDAAAKDSYDLSQYNTLLPHDPLDVDRKSECVRGGLGVGAVPMAEGAYFSGSYGLGGNDDALKRYAKVHNAPNLGYNYSFDSVPSNRGFGIPSGFGLAPKRSSDNPGSHKEGSGGVRR